MEGVLVLLRCLRLSARLLSRCFSPRPAKRRALPTQVRLLMDMLQADASDEAWGQNCDAIVIIAGAAQEDVVSFPKVRCCASRYCLLRASRCSLPSFLRHLPLALRWLPQVGGLHAMRRARGSLVGLLLSGVVRTR